MSYPGTGTTGPFAYPFRIFAAVDLLVTKRTALNAEITLANIADYTVSGVGDLTGNVTPTVAVAVGETLVIRRKTLLGQPVSVRNNSAYYASVHEDEFDRLSMQILSLQDQLDRSFGVSESYDPATLTLRVRPETGKVLGWDSNSVLTNKQVDTTGVILPGAGRTTATLSAFLANNAVYNVLDYMPVGNDLATALLNAIAAVPATGGIVDASTLAGAQSITSKISIAKANVAILFGAATFTLSGVAAAQAPFGANFVVSAANVWLISHGSQTTFKVAAGSQACPIAFLHGTASLGGVLGIELDGNKANNVSLPDDTFQTGIVIIRHAASGAVGESRITIRGCRIHDFNHYGIATWGDLGGNNTIEANWVYSNGKADAFGTGDGIYINLGSGYNSIRGNYCYSNQRSGIRLTAVGYVQRNNKIVGNWCYSNTEDGIRADEQLNLASTVDVGQLGLEISFNHCYSNTGHGIKVGTFDNVGVIADYSLIGNHTYSNGGYGIILQGNAHATSNTRRGTIFGNQSYLNTADGIIVAGNVLDTLVALNATIGNGGAGITDAGTRTLKYGNKENITDGMFNAGATTFSGTVAFGDQQATWNEAAVRLWLMTHGSGGSSGKFRLESGDGLGAIATNVDLELLTGKKIKVNGNAIIGDRGAAVADATGAGDVVAQLNALLARVRAHGLIA
ncbi:MAG: hypothetical protein JWL97_2962 [Gemmatimonadales bacterium]|nr:hypothetical protein [Gemmatimonadales bacterium]